MNQHIQVPKVRPPYTGHLKMGTEAAKCNGKEVLDVNNRFFTRNGKPWLPVVGEFHFQRYDHNCWTEELRKMKAGGIDVVATYLFWNHIEWEEGVFKFEGDSDLHGFLERCKENGLLVALRMGPWAHGEARNGGFPDWLVNCCPHVRCDEEPYLTYVDRLFAHYADEIRGLLWKDGGPVILAQMDNELGNRGHLVTLKRIAQKYGIDLPYYTMTSWAPTEEECPAAKEELLPFSGYYVTAPWIHTADIEPLWQNPNFWPHGVDHQNQIGVSELVLPDDTTEQKPVSHELYPYATCELGAGMQFFYERRPVIAAMDVYAAALSLLGSGVNLLGYYMFHGGRNPNQMPLQETEDATYDHDLPAISYDYQAPLGEYGFARESFGYFRLLHHFVHLFSDWLPTLAAFCAEKQQKSGRDVETPRVCLRMDDTGSGFLFANTHQRIFQIAPAKNLTVTYQIGETTRPVFDHPIDIPSGVSCIFPVNVAIDGVTIHSATVQPVTKIRCGERTVLFFAAIDGIPAEITLAGEDAREVCPSRRIAFSKGPVDVVVLSYMDALRLQIINGSAYLSDDLLTDESGQVMAFGQAETQPLVFRAETGAFQSCCCQLPAAYAPEISLEPTEKTMFFHNKFTPFLLSRNLNWCPEYLLTFPKDVFEHCTDVKLMLDGDFDIIQIYDGETIMADDYNAGVHLCFGLSRFREAIEAGRSLRIKISPLGEKKIYLERYVGRGEPTVSVYGTETFYRYLVQ